MEALKAGERTIERICLQRGQKNPRIQQIIDLSRQNHVQLAFEDKTWMDRKIEGRRHQGVLCYISEMAACGVEEILEKALFPGLIVVLDGIEDPQNLGAILRSAEVAAADGVFLPMRRSSGLSPVAMKASAGAAVHVRVARIPNTVQALELLKKNGYWVAGLEGTTGGAIWEADFTVPTALVVGNEGAGLHRLVRERCDFLVSIPLRGKIGSHNAAVAAGIALYEVVRQRALQRQRL